VDYLGNRRASRRFNLVLAQKASWYGQAESNDGPGL